MKPIYLVVAAAISAFFGTQSIGVSYSVFWGLLAILFAIEQRASELLVGVREGPLQVPLPIRAPLKRLRRQTKFKTTT